jgi:hypothetical protein
MQTKEVIRSQYHASLEMLKQAVVKCPESLWNRAADKNKFWHLAYHALFYTHLYLQPTVEVFTPWEKHRDQYNYMGPMPEPPHDWPKIGEPYTTDEILDYLQLCQKQVDEIVDQLDLAGQSGFFWLPMGKLELQFYSIRHLMQHTGELCERLGTAGFDVDWIGMKPA